MNGVPLVGVSLVSAYLLGWVARMIAPRLRMMDVPEGEMKPHERPVPALGGIAIVGGVAIGLLARFVTSGEGQLLPRWGSTAAIIGAFVLGMIDDRRGVRPLVRFIVEVGLGALLAIALPAVALPGIALASVVTVVLFVAVLNGVNMVDGLDGLAGGCAAIAAVGMIWIGVRPQGLVVALVTLGAALGFLVHNWPPARLFLGDGGAYALGAALTVAILAHGRTPQTLVGGITCLGLFMMDLGLAVLRRIFGGAPLMSGDRNHFYDQLMRRGHSARATLLWCLVLQTGFVAAGIGLSQIGLSKVSVAVFVVFSLVVAGVLWVTGFVRPRAEAEVAP